MLDIFPVNEMHCNFFHENTLHHILFTQPGTKSIAHYTPQNMLGYGSLLCWASNVIGKAKEPCVYKVVPVGK